MRAGLVLLGLVINRMPGQSNVSDQSAKVGKSSEELDSVTDDCYHVFDCIVTPAEPETGTVFALLVRTVFATILTKTTKRRSVLHGCMRLRHGPMSRAFGNSGHDLCAAHLRSRREGILRSFALLISWSRVVHATCLRLQELQNTIAADLCRKSCFFQVPAGFCGQSPDCETGVNGCARLQTGCSLLRVLSAKDCQTALCQQQKHSGKSTSTTTPSSTILDSDCRTRVREHAECPHSNCQCADCEFCCQL